MRGQPRQGLEHEGALGLGRSIRTARRERELTVEALARAAGIPAQIEAGLVYQKGRFYYHAWNALYLGEWITTDAVFNQLPADVTHIRLAKGDRNLYFDLMGIVGKIGVEVVAAQ